jgi:50S ribosomal protein L16 3-hydroxylase
MGHTLLGGLSPRTFLARHWQRRPLLVRSAFPAFRDPVRIAGLFALAAREDVESRVVRRRAGKWILAHGPFSRAALARMPGANWTLLVQGVNHFVPDVDDMMRRFAFASYARLDDVMVSYAARGGGVGPHLDSYDVFLVQGAGRRRWQIARPRPYRVDARAPLRVLTDFRSEQEWVLEPGDLLYVPPGWAHDGVALEPCLTYSVGFRAPTAQELAVGYLQFLEDRLARPGRYADRGLAPQRRPARLGDDLLGRYTRLLRGLPGTRADIVEFLGRHLSEPKPDVRFTPPSPAMGMTRFVRAVRSRGLRLAGATILLYRRNRFFVNGESVTVRAAQPLLAQLADRRVLEPGILPAGESAALLYNWYRYGYLAPGESDG